MPRPHELRVVQYETDGGYYLLYCDESGEEMTDGFHLTLEEAFGQAEFEFGIKSTEWKQYPIQGVVGPPSPKNQPTRLQLEPQLRSEIEEMIGDGKIIEAIRLCVQKTGADLATARATVEAMKSSSE